MSLHLKREGVRVLLDLHTPTPLPLCPQDSTRSRRTMNPKKLKLQLTALPTPRLWEQHQKWVYIVCFSFLFAKVNILATGAKIFVSATLIPLSLPPLTISLTPHPRHHPLPHVRWRWDPDKGPPLWHKRVFPCPSLSGHQQLLKSRRELERVLTPRLQERFCEASTVLSVIAVSVTIGTPLHWPSS